MAAVTKTGTPSLCTTLPSSEHRISGLLAGEALGACDACVIKSDGKVYKATGAANDANARVHGWSAQETAAGEAVTLYHDVNFNYGTTTITSGANYYLGTTAGQLDTAATTGGLVPIAFGLPGNRLRVLRDLKA